MVEYAYKKTNTLKGDSFSPERFNKFRGKANRKK